MKKNNITLQHSIDFVIQQIDQSKKLAYKLKNKLYLLKEPLVSDYCDKYILLQEAAVFWQAHSPRYNCPNEYSYF